jgi:SAM-dependent methyltransferase
LSLQLVASFRELWAIDLEPEMIEAGRRLAAERGVGTVKWLVGRAEELQAPAASFDLITIGEAFHRLDQRRVAELALGWLKPGCPLATLGCYTILSEKEPWQKVVGEVVRRWTPPRTQKGAASASSGAPGGPDHNERVMRDVGFVEVGTFPFVEAHVWTIDTILGYLFSTSVCSKAVLGKNAPEFEAELRAALLACDPGGTYREDIEWGYTIGSKPNPGNRPPGA